MALRYDTLGTLLDEGRHAEIDERMAKAREYGKMANNRAKAAVQPPPAPFKARFPWELFREVLDGEKTIDDLETKLQDLLLPDDAFNIVSREGKTPLELAKESGNTELVDLLERAGAKGGRRRSRLNVKRRGTKRHGRSRKHRKLRKLTTRRR